MESGSSQLKDAPFQENTKAIVLLLGQKGMMRTRTQALPNKKMRKPMKSQILKDCLHRSLAASRSFKGLSEFNIEDSAPRMAIAYAAD
jgi:hypothetical protein